MPIQTYADAVAFWNSRVNYERIGMPGTSAELKLEQMQKLMVELGQPHLAYKCIHITGTKGKGSTAAMLASVLRTAGHRVGLYTSPHLVKLEERIQVNGVPITESELTRLMAEVEAASYRVEATGEAPPTFFEIITALGFLYFQQAKCDWAVLEVGLGGRYDATNVCKPEACIITNISLDHMEHLGPTISHIAREKAGIIKPEVPVITGVTQPEVIDIIEEVSFENLAPPVLLGWVLNREHKEGDLAKGIPDQVRCRYGTTLSPWMNLPLPGKLQANNAALVWMTIVLLGERKKLRVTKKQIALGLERTIHPARFEIVRKNPWIILDCAHNMASMAYTLALFSRIPGKRRWLLFSVSRDKQYEEMLELLKREGGFDGVIFTKTSSPRSVPPDILASSWERVKSEQHCSVEIQEEAKAAYQQIRNKLSPDDALLITGSVFLAGDLRNSIISAESL